MFGVFRIVSLCCKCVSGVRCARFNRYCVLMDSNSMSDKLTSEDTIDFDNGDCVYKVVDENHCNYDYVMEKKTQAGKRFAAVFSGVPGARRRQDSRLGVSRIPLLEMSGSGREGFYQQRLLLSLAWWCSTPVESLSIDGKDVLQWTFQWSPPSPDDIGGAHLETEVMKIATVPETGFSFEERCKQLEIKFGDAELGVVCACYCQGIAEKIRTYCFLGLLLILSDLLRNCS